MTGVDGQSRTSDEAADRPLQVRYDQKWLNMVASQSKTVCGLLLQFSLTLVKFMVSLKLSLKKANSAQANSLRRESEKFKD